MEAWGMNLGSFGNPMRFQILELGLFSDWVWPQPNLKTDPRAMHKKDPAAGGALSGFCQS